MLCSLSPWRLASSSPRWWGTHLPRSSTPQSLGYLASPRLCCCVIESGAMTSTTFASWPATRSAIDPTRSSAKQPLDLRDRDRATVRVTEQLRFTRNDVSTITDWSQGDGEVVRYKGQWRRSENEAWLPAQMIHKFPIRNGEKVIYSLDEEHCRGDELYWYVERDAVGRFPNAHEAVSLEARTKSDHPRLMYITWPPDAAPSHVELRFDGQPARTLSTRRKNGRAYVEEKIVGLPVGKVVKIAWTW
jgi:hypothetical protein